jgi:hypothetical protein
MEFATQSDFLRCEGDGSDPITRTPARRQTMDRREFIAAAGTAAAIASTSQAFAQAMGGGEEEMHPPKYKALEKTAIDCVATGIVWPCIR